MSDSAPTEPVERCPECGLAPYSSAITGLDAFSCCFARDGNTMARLNCAERTIDRLRSELSTLRERNQLEAAVVEAAIATRLTNVAFVAVDPMTATLEQVELQHEIAHAHAAALDKFDAALDALLAHRAQKGADDGNG